MYIQTSLSKANKQQLRSLCREYDVRNYGLMNNAGMRKAIYLKQTIKNGGLIGKIKKPVNQATPAALNLFGILGAPAHVVTKKEKMPERNGIKMPKHGTLCRKIWNQCDLMHKNGNLSFSSINDWGNAEGINMYTIRTQFQRWRGFYGFVNKQS